MAAESADVTAACCGDREQTAGGAQRRPQQPRTTAERSGAVLGMLLRLIDIVVLQLMIMLAMTHTMLVMLTMLLMMIVWVVMQLMMTMSNVSIVLLIIAMLIVSIVTSIASIIMSCTTTMSIISSTIMSTARWMIALFTVSPLELASGYACAALAALGGGGALSLQVRSLLAHPGLHVDGYYAAVTWHALLMIFGWVMPLLFGVIANGTVAAQVGVSDLLLPRLNSAGLWLLIDAVALMLITQAVAAPTGWTLYPPLAAAEGAGVDWAIIALHVAGISSLVLAVNLLATTYCSYQARLAWRSIPLVWWSTAVANVLLVVTLPALAAAITMLLLDRRANTGYYAVDAGGDPVLYQHLFWFFGHPEVYVLVLPPFGYVSALIISEARGAVVNTPAMTLALVTIGSVSMVVYGHHLYTTGMNADDRAYFSFATYLIAIPTGVKYFTWLSTLNHAAILHSLPAQAATGFMWYFAIGGLTGVVLADGALDAPMHDAYYVVGHFHLVMAVAIMYAAAGYLLVELSMAT